jgi:hypothetical protein
MYRSRSVGQEVVELMEGLVTYMRMQMHLHDLLVF